MSRKIHHAIVALAATVFLGGCVSQEKYDAQKLRADGMAAQLSQADKAREAAEARAASYKSQLDQVMNQSGSESGLIANLRQQNESLRMQLDKLQAQYASAVNSIGTGPLLPVAVRNELAEFARQNPDLVEFDEQRGMVKFRSDLTFASGSAEVQPEARTAISRFAGILNSPAASGYELLVAGHTDNEKVSNPATLRAGHKDNRYLSNHRAISVAEVMIGQGISPRRIGTVGYGEFRPIASNDTKQGRSQNRRVEVLILPSEVQSQQESVQPQQAAAEVAPAMDDMENTK